jgi:hypothetical protein
MVMQSSSVSRTAFHSVSRVLGSVVACGSLAAACWLSAGGHALAASERALAVSGEHVVLAASVDAASNAKANTGKKSSADVKAARAEKAEKKKAERAARMAAKNAKKSGHDSSDDKKVAKADSKSNDDAMGGSDDPLEGL